MNSPAEKIGRLSDSQQLDFIKKLSKSACKKMLYQWRGFLARHNQLPPEGDWAIWLVLAGRGFGKTRMGAEWVREQVEIHGIKRIALVGETAEDTRSVMVEGESGLLKIYPPEQRPLYEPSKRQITWANGAIAKIYNATEPDQLRGPQHEIAWCDELAKWRYARETWDQLQFGMRLGKNPQQIITTTPRPIELINELMQRKEGKIIITRGKTSDNQSYLAKAFLAKIRKRYEGTRLGRQELSGEILGDLPGALWNLDTINKYRKPSAPDNLARILIAVDPAISNNEDSDEHGIIAVGIKGQEGYVLEDGSIKGSPLQWARRALALYDKYEADGIVVEINQGGDMVSQTIKSVRDTINIIEVRASRGKHVRSEPIAALYEQGKVHHIGVFAELESQMILMTTAGFEGNKSPDRLDALVWSLTALFPDLIHPPHQTLPRFMLRKVV